VEFRVAHAARITGEMLERLVREKLRVDGIPEPDAVVCYGAGYSGTKPALNARCSVGNKMTQGIELHAVLGDEALAVIPVRRDLTFHIGDTWIARKIKHAKGKDMRVCKSVKALQGAIEKGRQYFTPLVDSDTEYRVWVYRKRVLAAYEKRLTEPQNNTKFGRNRANGFTFHGLNSENIPESVRRVAIAAVRCVQLDFGAVDILGKWVDDDHTDVHATVLEVNSAPGVSDEHRTAIVKLVNRVVRWAANGCPGREA
jgi:hypothetical protein